LSLHRFTPYRSRSDGCGFESLRACQYVLRTWKDQRSSDDDIYAQRVDGGGNALSYTNGVTVCVASNIESDQQIASDGYWGAIITWEDYRNAGTTGYDIHAQRVGGFAEVGMPLVMKRE